MIRLQVEADARRRGDVAALADALAARITDVAGAEPTRLSYSTRRRGGRVYAEVSLPDVDADGGHEIAETLVLNDVARNRNLIERIDWIRCAVWGPGDLLAGFAQMELRGWMREAHLADLAEGIC